MRHRLCACLSTLVIVAALDVNAQDSPGTMDSHENDIEALEPGVDTSAPQSRDTEGSATDGEIDDEAAVSSQIVADVSRSQSNGYVMDRLELSRTEITGNQELPKVLYIVPWQKAGPGDLLGRPVNSLLDEVLAPVDRDEFVRDVGFYDEIHSRRLDEQ